jgi:cell division protein FtsQ
MKQQTERERQCKKISRQRASRQRMRVMGRRVAIAFSALAVMTGGVFCWSFLSGNKLAKWQNQAVADFWQVTADAGFQLQNVYLTGHQKVQNQTILNALGVKTGQPILAYSLPELKAELEKIPLIHHAQVARVLPNTLKIEVKERHAVAVWQHQGVFQLVDREGAPMGKIRAGQYARLPLLVGNLDAEHIRDFFVFLGTMPKFAKRVESATLISERRWNLSLDNGIQIKLPEQQLQEAQVQLDALYAENIFNRRDIEVIDLRIPDKLFIRPLKEEASPSSADAQST